MMFPFLKPSAKVLLFPNIHKKKVILFAMSHVWLFFLCEKNSLWRLKLLYFYAERSEAHAIFDNDDLSVVKQEFSPGCSAVIYVF